MGFLAFVFPGLAFAFVLVFMDVLGVLLYEFEWRLGNSNVTSFANSQRVSSVSLRLVALGLSTPDLLVMPFRMGFLAFVFPGLAFVFVLAFI
jgi:hypothetical protein